MQVVLEKEPRDPREGDLAVWIIAAGAALGADWVVVVETSQAASPGPEEGTEEISAPVSVAFDAQGVDVHTGQVSLTFQDHVERRPAAGTNPQNLDAILVLGDPDRDLAPVATQLSYFGLNVPIFGAEEWGLPRVLRLLRDQAEGVYFLSPFTPQSPLPESAAFVQAFQGLHDEIPETAFAAQAFEAARAVLDVFKGGARTSQAIQKALLARDRFQGPGGTFHFLPNGDVTREMPLYLIRGGAVVLAPQSPSPSPPPEGEGKP